MCDVFASCVFYMLNWMYTVLAKYTIVNFVIVYAYRSYSSTCPVSVNYQVMFEPKPNANKKMVQMQLTNETGKVILLKDLANVVTSAKQGDTRNSVDGAVDILSTKYGKYCVAFTSTPLVPLALQVLISTCLYSKSSYFAPFCQYNLIHQV